MNFIQQHQNNRRNLTFQMMTEKNSALEIDALKNRIAELEKDVSSYRHNSTLKQTEEKLRESQRRLSTLMSNLPGMAYRMFNERTWPAEFVSEGTLALTGYKPEELERGPHHRIDFGELIYPDDRDYVWEVVQKGIQQQQPYEITYRIITADGALRWVWEKGRGVFEEDGNLHSLEGFITDTTDHRNFELAIQQRASQLAILNKVGEQIAAVLDLDSVFQRAVQLVQESFGYHHVGIFTVDHQSKEIVMQAKSGGFDALFPPHHTLKIGQGMVGWTVENNQTLLSNDVTTEKRFVNLYPETLPTRSEVCVPIHIQEKVIGVLDAQSPHTEAFEENDVIVLQTLADQIAIAIENARLHAAVHAELSERQRAEAKLRESEERYRLLFEHSSEAIFILDPQTGQYLDANLAAEKLSGRTLAELKNLSTQEVNLDGALERLQQMAQHFGVSESGEVEYLHPDQSSRTALLSTIRVKDDLAFGIARDITERKKLDDALRNIAAGVSATTGTEFFQKLVQYLANSLKIRYAFVGELHNNKVQTIAVCDQGKITDNFDYALTDSPFANPEEQNLCCYPHGVQKLFPQDELLAKMDIESFAGTPLFDSAGQPIGLLVIMHDQRIENQEMVLSLLQIFAVRVATELDRLHVEAEVQRRANQLAALNQMGQLVTSSLNIEQVLEQVIHVVPPLVNADGVSILLRENPRELVFAAASGQGAKNLKGQKIPADAGIAGQVLAQSKPVMIKHQDDQKQLYRNIEDISGYHTQSLLAVPLILGSETIGVMEAVHAQPNAFTEDDLQIIETAGAWASIAIDNARQHAATERRLKESQAVASINQALNETLELDRLLQLIVDSINQTIPQIERTVIHLYDEENKTLIPTAVSGVEPNRKPYLRMKDGQGIAGQVIESGQSINVRDTHLDDRFVPIDGAHYLRALLVVPVQSSGRRLGTISVSSTTPEAFTDEDEHLLSVLGIQAALAIESARLFDEIQQRAQHLELLNDITQVALQQPDLQTILSNLVERLQTVFNSDGCYISLWDAKNKITIPAAAIGTSAKYYQSPIIQPQERTLTQSVLEVGHALVIHDISKSKYISKKIASEFDDRCVLALPLIAGQQQLGALIISFCVIHRFPPDEIERAENIAQQIALAISKAQLLELEQQRRREAETLRDITTVLTSTLDIDQVLSRILEQLHYAITYDTASVFLLEGSFARVVAVQGFGDPENVIGFEVDAKIGTFQEIIDSQSALVLEDVLDDPRWVYYEGFADIRSWMGIPMMAEDNVLGFLTIDSHHPGTYHQADASLAQAFANQAAVALQNARLYAATRRRLSETNTLYFISNLIVQSPDLDVDAILHQVVDLLWREFDFYHVHVYLFDQASGALIANQGSGSIGTQLKEMGYQFTSDEGIVGYAATIGEPFMTNHVADTHFYMPHPLLPDTTAELAAPLKSRDEILGVLDIQHAAPHTFDNADFRFLVAVADQLAVVLDKALLYQELEAALLKEQKTRDQLVQSEKLAAMGRLIASVAHELNNPLQAIQNALYLVKLEENLSPQAAGDLQVAIDEGARMAGLIARLRDTYRPTIAADYQMESVNILVEEVQKLINTHLRHNNVNLKFMPDPELPQTRIIRDQIKQVILNLCINAIESMPDGGDLTIQSLFVPELNEVHLNVRDTGAGLPADVQSKIFEPFFTTKEGGTGLGLAVSYEIAQNHGGSIEAQNNGSDPGATFTLSLPCPDS